MQNERMRLAGSVRLMIDTSGGLRTACGQIVDLSAGGCAIRVHRSIDCDLAGRVRIEIAGNATWLPVITRSVREDSRGWTVDCTFDRLTPDKARVISALLSDRRRLTA
jgi:PilZ domain